jgi:uncharacterized protein YdeI (BOF family)
MDCETTLKGEINMKKFAAIAAIMMMTTAPVLLRRADLRPVRHANPDATQQGGFVDNNANLTTAAKVKEMKDDAG